MSKLVDDGGARERLRELLGDITTVPKQQRKPKIPSASAIANLIVLDYVAALKGNAKSTTEKLLPDDRVLARWSHPICLTTAEHLILSGHGEYLLLELPDDFSDEAAPGHHIFMDDFGRASGFEGPWCTWRHYLCHHCELLDWMHNFMDSALRQFDAEVYSRRKRT
jgi:hypothetical protein